MFVMELARKKLADGLLEPFSARLAVTLLHPDKDGSDILPKHI